jgi:hypothetical protein
MKLETYRTKTGEVAVKGSDFKVLVRQDGSITLHFGDEVKYIDWLYIQKKEKGEPQ